MIKCFVCGDLHFGRKHVKLPEIRDRLIRSRYECLENCVKEADKEHCDFFIITGDLFDNTNKITQKEVKEVVRILSGFGGVVLVLPGNHDCYSGEEKVWKDFKNALQNTENQIQLITEYRHISMEAGEEQVTFYPAYCHTKHSKENKLDWIRKESLDPGAYHIGLAHGTLVGFTPDEKMEYYPMKEKELLAIPMDVWFLGHTHVPYPRELKAGEEITGQRIFNAGTPEALEFSNNTPGLCLLVTLDKAGGSTKVTARPYQSGAIRYFDLEPSLGEAGLQAALQEALKDLPADSVVRVKLKGSVSREDYEDRQRIYQETLGGFLTYNVEDEELSERITHERIRSEFAEIGFAVQWLEALTDPREIQMAYDLVKNHQH